MLVSLYLSIKAEVFSWLKLEYSVCFGLGEIGVLEVRSLLFFCNKYSWIHGEFVTIFYKVHLCLFAIISRILKSCCLEKNLRL